MSRSPGKYVDLAEMSVSGTLQPAVPVQVLLKYNPPKLTIVYHFENSDREDQYFHNIMFDRNMLDNDDIEDILNHLYMAEAYYFNPKVLKRHQVKRLVEKLKNRAGTFSENDRSPERHSIHSQSYNGSGSPPPMRRPGSAPQNQLFDGGRSQSQQQQPAFLGGNIDGLNIHQRRSPPRQSANNSNGQNDQNSQQQQQDQGNQPVLTNHNSNFAKNGKNMPANTSAAMPNSSSFQQMQQQSAFQRRKNFFERKRLLQVQAHNPMEFQNLTDPPAAMNQNNNNQQQQRGRTQNVGQANAGTSSNSGSPQPAPMSAAFQQQENINNMNFQAQAAPHLRSSLASGGRGKLPPLETVADAQNMNSITAGQTKTSLNSAIQRKPNRAQHLVNAMHERMPIDGNGPNNYPSVGTVPPSAPSVSQQSSAISGKQNSMAFPQNSPIQANHAMSTQMSIYDNQNQIQQQQQHQNQQQFQQNQSFNNDDQQQFQNQYQNHQGISGGGQELLADGDESSANNNYGQEIMNHSQQNQSMNGEEHLSVYMKDNNVVMRRIQIEGDERDFLMDPEGNIFDMQGTFIGTANTNELEELNEDSQQQPQGDGGGQAVSNNPQEEMMLLDDDDDVVTNANENTPGLNPHQQNSSGMGFAGQMSADGATMDMDMDLGSAGSQGGEIYGTNAFQQQKHQQPNMNSHMAYVQ